ncbi:hypothetical protein OCC_02832 [Thermococcus litoralis DSM 5473]|uniref:PEGA domain-containing protein n=1 Tax=Thermococcus litoralis (strain ATCC 51850 / DSM 5473 / JCM 8560 / NS-C) TaxID=523849 RepID=H3ZPY8_THELN|nr:hypothetical protein [Thermococcus litoralis]EHR77951.1 hypothetical protein OCC_02832 [Thermococcus litoralis DSM 5473]
MRKALSLVLGLLVLLTVFSNTVKAENIYLEHFDGSFSFSRTSVDAYLYYDQISFPSPIRAELIEFYLVQFDVPSEGWQYIYIVGEDGYKYGIRTWAGSSNTIEIQNRTSDLKSYSTLATLTAPAEGSKVLFRLEWDNNVGAYIASIYVEENGSFTLFDQAQTSLTTKLSAIGWGIGGNNKDLNPAYSVSNSILTYTSGAAWHIEVDYVKIAVNDYNVLFNLKDALTGQGLTGVTVKEGNTTLGTISDGESLTLSRGTHNLTFEKSGYWSVTKTIDVQSDMSVSIEMYPSDTAFKFLNFPSDIQVYENTIYELTFTISPITTDATYNTYLSISGLNNLLEVKKAGQAISPESGKYYLGDISSPVQVSIKFKAGAVGQHGFTLSVESHDAIMSKTYTTTKSVTYTVEPLPFSVQVPSEWQVGTNTLRISESSGQSYLITAVLKDSSGNEVWSDSHAFSPYEAYSFSVNVPSEGSYTLELQWNGQVATYDVIVNPAITLTTKTLTVQKGGEGTIVLHFKNPSSDVQYYTIKVSGGFLPSEINQSISVGPLTEKDVSISFAVPEELTYDAYELQVQVLQGNTTVFSDKVAVSISDSGGFTLFGGSSSGNTWLWLGVGGLGLLALVGLARRR